MEERRSRWEGPELGPSPHSAIIILSGFNELRREPRFPQGRELHMVDRLLLVLCSSGVLQSCHWCLGVPHVREPMSCHHRHRVRLIGVGQTPPGRITHAGGGSPGITEPGLSGSANGLLPACYMDHVLGFKVMQTVQATNSFLALESSAVSKESQPVC